MQLYWGSTEVAKALGIKSRTTALEIMKLSGLAIRCGKRNAAIRVPVDAFLRWYNSQTIRPAEKKAPPPPRKRVKIEGLTEDGLIPYRKSKKGA